MIAAVNVKARCPCYSVTLPSLDGNSQLVFNLLYNNETDNSGASINLQDTVFADPFLTDELVPTSPAIDAWTASFDWKESKIMDIPSSAFSGTAPEFGPFELNADSTPPDQPTLLEPLSGQKGLSLKPTLKWAGRGETFTTQFSNDTAFGFALVDGNISTKSKTLAAVPGFPEPLTKVGQAGPDQRTPDMSLVLQESVSRPEWSSSNALANFITGIGKRIASSFNGNEDAAPCTACGIRRQSVMEFRHSTERDRGRTRSAGHLLRLVVLAVSFLITACGSGSGSTTEILQLSFVTQPSDTNALLSITPPVEVLVTDESGAARDGTVSITIEPNYCGATLAGTLSVATQGGAASFPDLSIDLVASGYVLKASFDSAKATSKSFDVTSSATGETLTERATICLTPNEQRDASSLAYVSQDDALWTADDDLPGVHAIARATGTFLHTIRSDEFLAAFPDAALCDDGDGNPATSCSYVDEFEVLTFDPLSGALYVINTVNDQNLNPPIDKPAIFRLLRQSCASCFGFDAWQELPGGFSYNSAVAIDGQIYIANNRELYPYEFASNTVDDQVAPLLLPETIRGLTYDGTNLWVLHESRLRKLEWPSGTEVAVHELGAFSVFDLLGLEKVDDVIYMLENGFPNPIRRFAETP